MATRYGKDKASWIGSVDGALDADAFPELAAMAPAVRRLYDAATLVASEAWVRNVYGYFRNSYAPHDGEHAGTRNVSYAERTGPPDHHLGYLCVREYFPDHEIRADLIADPGRGYGSWPCDRCGQRVQYEARWDAFVVYPAGLDCPAGDGGHAVSPVAP